MTQTMVDLRLRQSKTKYVSPTKARDEMMFAMSETARKYPWP